MHVEIVSDHQQKVMLILHLFRIDYAVSLRPCGDDNKRHETCRASTARMQKHSETFATTLKKKIFKSLFCYIFNTINTINLHVHYSPSQQSRKKKRQPAKVRPRPESDVPDPPSSTRIGEALPSGPRQAVIGCLCERGYAYFCVNECASDC